MSNCLYFPSFLVPARFWDYVDSFSSEMAFCRLRVLLFLQDQRVSVEGVKRFCFGSGGIGLLLKKP